MSSDLVFDLVLCTGLVWSATGALLGRDRYRSVILFIVFGLLMTVAWVRLAAPDIALAEAAIGAGLTGALLLDALGGGSGTATGSRGSRWLLAPLACVIVALLAGTLLALPTPSTDLRAAVAAALPDSGVTHPVTAVLLNFRGYDTLLEVAVLIAALLGVLSAARLESPVRLSAAPVLQAAARALVPLMVLTAGYLLWAGAHRPGGAFQAAAVLAAGAVLLALVGLLDGWARPSWRVRAAIALGPAVFLLVAAPRVGQSLLLYLPSARAGLLILLIEAALTLSLGFALAGLFLALLRGDEAKGNGA
ncbi:MAG: hydrogen gas-evolving membrane-bound hydrogenase subunit E [Gammaproteobacteria bacterium]